MRRAHLLLVLLSMLVPASLVPASAHAEPAHGIAMHGTPQEPAGFPYFPYVNPDAPKGGRLTLGVLGTFDSLNPMIVKGVPAAGIREFVIESLMTRGLDEPFTLYGLLAESVEVPDDRSSITFHINPEAHFSDGTPVTADDVLFSFEVLKTKGRPNHRTYFNKVASTERISERAVRFTFDASGDREMPLILGLMPVLPRHLFDAETFERTTLEPLVGSGPYRIGKVEAGRSITYERDPDYWGRDLPVNRGRFNFAQIRFDYFRDASVLFEAFKTGRLDFRSEEDPARWAQGYDVPAVRAGQIVKEEIETGLPAGMTALVFNMRHAPFDDQRVRRALIHLFDFEWVNRRLYHGLYKRTESYFERSYLASTGKPADDCERRLLAPYHDAVRPEILEGTFRFPRSDGSGRNRKNWREALRLLGEAGYSLEHGRLVHPHRGPLSFEILATVGGEERLLVSYASELARIGVEARVRVVDSTQYQARLTTYDYDMILNTWPTSLSPGNEQLFRWSSEAARVEGTFNFAGVENAAADAMIEALLSAKAPDEFVSAVRALDRVLLSGDYVIPLFHLPRLWVAHWRHLRHPERFPLLGYNLDNWWFSNEAE